MSVGPGLDHECLLLAVLGAMVRHEVVLRLLMCLTSCAVSLTLGVGSEPCIQCAVLLGSTCDVLDIFMAAKQ